MRENYMTTERFKVRLKPERSRDSRACEDFLYKAPFKINLQRSENKIVLMIIESVHVKVFID